MASLKSPTTVDNEIVAITRGVGVGYDIIYNTLGTAGEKFGNAVAFCGNRIVVGAPYRNAPNATNAGSATIFDEKGNAIKKLYGDNQTTSAYFGRAVAVSEDRVVISATGEHFDKPGAGAVYIYDTEGNFIKKVHPTPGLGSIDFGSSVSVYGNRIVVGASGDNDRTPSALISSGMVYIFDKNGNTIDGLYKKIPPYVPSVGSLFGYSVAVNDKYIAVGEPGYNTIGAVSLYDIDGNYLDSFTDNVSVANAKFGYSVALYGDRVIVGAPVDTVNGIVSGSVSIFKFGTQSRFVAKILCDTPQSGQEFGRSVSISGDRILVGTPFYTNGTYTGSGCSCLYDANGYFIEKIITPVTYANFNSGMAVSISGDKLVIGVPSDNSILGPDTGRCILYDIDGETIGDVGTLLKGLGG